MKRFLDWLQENNLNEGLFDFWKRKEIDPPNSLNDYEKMQHKLPSHFRDFHQYKTPHPAEGMSDFYNHFRNKYTGPRPDIQNATPQQTGSDFFKRAGRDEIEHATKLGKWLATNHPEIADQYKDDASAKAASNQYFEKAKKSTNFDDIITNYAWTHAIDHLRNFMLNSKEPVTKETFARYMRNHYEYPNWRSQKLDQYGDAWERQRKKK